MFSLTILGWLVPYNNGQFHNGGSSSDANASHFVIAVKNSQSSAVALIMNTVMLIAVPGIRSSLHQACGTVKSSSPVSLPW
jgi:amino acid transporter